MKFRNVVRTHFSMFAMLALLLTTSTANAKGPPQEICPDAAKISPPLTKSHMLSRCLENDQLSGPDHSELSKRRATVYLELGRYKLALIDFKAALEFNPDDAEIYNGLGIVNKRLGNYEQAKTNYARAQKLRPVVAAPSITRQPQPITDITTIPDILPVKIEAITSKRVFFPKETMHSISIESPLAISEEMKYPIIDEPLQPDILAQ
ncbi:tetratricopeptide repeat protein [Desulfosediminicola flagellatus]|uniref:tetratricopeptide repeat protein n=1 Tax=Desulfosediminicola flagellatus TaxID=2569541 RepID=UPI0010ABA721|nr:tetratricopeptide repeat protein [Desulfosediminicola flagellatus]